MTNPEFPAKFYKKGDEPEPGRKMNHHSRMKLLSNLETALHRDEWEYLCNSPLGVFIKFYKLKFRWSSTLVHYMLTSQLACRQKYEIWCLIGAKPVRFSLNEFELLTGLNCEYIKDIEDPQTEVTEEMFPMWDGDVKDENIHNIVKAVFRKFGESGDWTFTSAHWSDEGVKSSKVVSVPNKKRSIDLIEERQKKRTLVPNEEKRQKNKTLVSSEEGILTSETLTNPFDALTKRVEALELIIEELKEGATFAADRDATNCVTWKQQTLASHRSRTRP